MNLNVVKICDLYKLVKLNCILTKKLIYFWRIMNHSQIFSNNTVVEFNEIYTAPDTLFLPGQTNTSWNFIGKLRDLYVRDARSSTPRRVQSVSAVAGFGLDGDIHLSSESPRQILIAGAPVYERWQLQENILRENFLFDFSIENLNSGDVLRIGADVLLWITFVCEPCRRLYDKNTKLREMVGNERGVLARVIREGVINKGDSVFLIPSVVNSISNKWQDRVNHVLLSLPFNVSISYSQLAELAGTSATYCRAFPSLLKKLPNTVSSRAFASKKSKK